MDDRKKNRASWKERLLDSWYQGPSKRTIPGNPIASSRFGQRHTRRALSATRASRTQSKCIFLTKVPGEIRNAIYMLLLGNRYIGIYSRGLGPWKDLVCHLELPPGQMSFPDPPLQFLPANKLPLLQTCRQVYIEVASLLYSTYQFRVLRMQDIKCFNRFMLTISPTRLATITNLALVVNVDYFEPLHHLASYTFKHWKRLWDVICLHMSALRHVTLRFRNLWIIENLKLTPDTYWVKPFLRLRNLARFELIVNREDIVGFESLRDNLRSSDAEEQAVSLISKVDRLRQYSTNLLCSPG